MRIKEVINVREKGANNTEVVGKNGIKNTKIYLNDVNCKAIAEKLNRSYVEDTTFMVSAGIAKERFGYAGCADLVRVPLKVDTSKLSDLGKIIAYSIITFENCDTLSTLWCYGPTQRELFIKEGRSKEYIDKIGQAFGEEWLDEDICIRWHWNRLKKYETPEQYIERQVEEMRNAGVKYFSMK